MNRLIEENSAQDPEEHLGTEPIGRLILTMSVPMMISFFIQAMYNIVDSMFVARISENALTAVSLAFPMQQIVNAISIGMGVGINAVVPRFLAMKNRDRAEQTVGVAVFFGLAFYALFAVLGLTASHAIYQIQTNVEEIVDLGTTYLTICWSLCLGCFFGQIFEKLLVCTGKATLAMLAQASGAVINLIFDPLLIFGIGPFPELGIAGAAAATVSGQIFAGMTALLLNIRKNRAVNIRPRKIRPDFASAKEIFSVGVPSMVNMGLSSVTTFAINQILLGYSTTATAVYGIWIKLQNFCFMPIFGMNNGTIPILSYNYTRGLKERVNRTYLLAATFSVVYLVLLTIVLEMIPGTLLMLFSASDNMLAIGTVAMRICIISLPFGGLCTITGTAMQAMQHARYTLTVNILRQFVFIIGMFALLSALTGELRFVWLAVPFTEMMSLIVALALLRKMMKELWK